MTNFIYTKHAELRIKERGFDKAQIEQVIDKPDKALPSFKGRSLVQKYFKGRNLEVVYRRENDDIIVITAYWLKEE